MASRYIRSRSNTRTQKNTNVQYIPANENSYVILNDSELKDLNFDKIDCIELRLWRKERLSSNSLSLILIFSFIYIIVMVLTIAIKYHRRFNYF